VGNAAKAALRKQGGCPLWISEIKRAGNISSRPVPFHPDMGYRGSTKNKHLLATGQVPTRGFTAVLSVFGGAPPPKPLSCKIRLVFSGDLRNLPRAHPTGDQPRLVCAKFKLSPEDITWMSFLSGSQIRSSIINRR
jgi:hypothetical protein